ncbi:MAG TPA: tryptophan--tRNA ligase [Candidatus Paceibacterota bacterium]|nr:tryptophan--tRNA ligase [Candidatus Paceibacterota bacterium]
MVKIFSGIRSSGQLHLGNYLGAIKNWIELQNKADQCIFAVVDYHGITTPYDPKTYQEQVLETAMNFLAAGVDPNKAFLIRQSKVPQHTELAWLFNTITPVSWLDRLPTYREQVEKSKVNNMGLLAYPILMAADILLYKSNLVPVGEDQLPHIDLTNEIAKRFNSTFGETFEPVKPYIAEGARIMSLQDPTKKMSKTGDEGIALSDSPDVVREKIKRATTDSGKEIKFDEQGKPGISNLLTIHSLLSGKEIPVLEKEYEGKSYVDFKNDVAEVVVEFLKPFQEKYKQFKNNMDHITDVLSTSEEKARVLADAHLQEFKQKMGV